MSLIKVVVYERTQNEFYFYVCSHSNGLHPPPTHPLFPFPNPGSSRGIHLQPIPPILHSALRGPVAQLPLMLQVIADKTCRSKFPRNAEVVEMLAQVSDLVLSSGGHPRAVQHLFGYMGQFHWR